LKSLLISTALKYNIELKLTLTNLKQRLYMTSPLTSTAALNLPNFSQVSSYLDLIHETLKALQQDTGYLKIEFLNDQEVFYKQNERKCAKETAIKNPYAKETEYKYLHANIVCKRWIATRAPIEQDLEKFWILAFSHNLIIVDLTNASDKSLRYGGSYQLYPSNSFRKAQNRRCANPIRG